MKTKILMPLWAGLFLFFLALAVVQALSLALGATSISIPEVLSVLAGEGSEHARRVIWELRLPRALLAVLVGMHLAVSGYLLQTLSRNPLADAGVLGISAGASLAAVLIVAPRENWNRFARKLEPKTFSISPTEFQSFKQNLSAGGTNRLPVRSSIAETRLSDMCTRL
ncbi:iron chelate uptake ABC transporter family permease subunit [Marinobacterium stanieri]|uniref:FecCD transport family protein n=1 Tax=Marinobacterium stanieri TaxID=49186 RepID=A0A1N6RQW1_9GAMM|nr:iron chelate uptake ABC transporter family permease subunit [Marinobacterium stanieri]SIQ31177.1 FecCD transport family protein [Marinobacterium stanieri]